EILAFAGLFTAFQTNANYVFMATGRMATSTWIGLLQFSLLAVALLLGVHWNGLVGAAWGVLVASAAILPVMYLAVRKELALGYGDYVSTLWRPLLGASLMLATVILWKQWLDTTELKDSRLLWLLSAIAIGALVYSGAVLLLWRIAGKPAGAEANVLGIVKAK